MLGKLTVHKPLRHAFHMALRLVLLNEARNRRLVEGAGVVELAGVIDALQEGDIPRRAPQEKDACIDHEPVFGDDDVVRVVDDVEDALRLVEDQGVGVGPEEPEIFAADARRESEFDLTESRLARVKGEVFARGEAGAGGAAGDG